MDSDTILDYYRDELRAWMESRQQFCEGLTEREAARSFLASLEFAEIISEERARARGYSF